jgi:hypothetical protein
MGLRKRQIMEVVRSLARDLSNDLNGIKLETRF